MIKHYILVNDMGTTGNKAALLDETLEVVASVSKTYETYYPKPNWSTQKISEVYKVVISCTKEVIEQSGIDPKTIAVVSFSNQMMTMVPVDRDGQVLMDEVGIWCDMRQHEQADRLMKQLGGNDEYYKITGVGWAPDLAPICKIMWYKDHAKDIYDSTYKFLQYKEIVAYRMTGIMATEYGDMSMNGMMNCAKKRLSESIFKAANVDPSKIPEIRNSDEIIGHVTMAAAREFGIPEGTPVTLGSGDVICANLGAGITQKGVGYTCIGSANWSAVFSDTPSLNPRYKMNCNTMQPTGGYNLVMITAAGGIAQDWFKKGFYSSEKGTKSVDEYEAELYKRMTEDTKSISPGAEGLLFYPYIRGGGAPHFDINARGSFIGLDISHTRSHMLRAIYEGVCLNMRWLYDLYEELGFTIYGLDTIRAIGGGVLNDLWMQIYADVNDMAFSRLNSPQQSTALGAAMIGGVGIGLWDSYGAATAKIGIDKTFYPNKEITPIYKDLYAIFRETYDNIYSFYAKRNQFIEKYTH
ncbi:Xylulose kinase (Xylulokinase) [Desulforapulum autotrophicum HRM2]|uniref:Xylulose kinase (Xylulokinase) n=1 Tax=Desulforapulum autotrophicum (strain ATCC 43914 / DSM 3382 / VKM B-1955 / HRM2) TaxID=177437 RepID=C0QHG0_DESAH|nr:FGGY-family carbohydrate kinase [Desulforapulum autotrophicum]ACN17819.1 Xylulose kinase (Xylulokinase) [Desulforapulum autotrophicum HRM2]